MPEGGASGDLPPHGPHGVESGASSALVWQEAGFDEHLANAQIVL
jgi:hypothetical protein